MMVYIFPAVTGYSPLAYPPPPPLPPLYVACEVSLAPPPAPRRKKDADVTPEGTVHV